MSERQNSQPQQFIATSPGLSATRWLAFVLGSHPDVFVAHGKFPLGSVVQTNFQEEKEKGDLESLTIGNDAATFYNSSSLREVFSAYREIKRDARAYGNIHTYTIQALMRLIDRPDELDQFRVVNVLRHPVSYIDSHFSLVRSAENHPELYRHYVENLLPLSLQQFPELFLVDCASYREFLAFAVSCLSVCNMAHDFDYAQFEHFRMESLVANPKELKRFCETLTGLAYSLDQLHRFIVEGPINRHRRSNASMDPQVIYSSWPDWKKDMAAIMIPDTVIDEFQKQGYDIEVFRWSEAKSTHTGESKRLPCLADHLKVMDEQHPLLTLLKPTQETDVPLVEKESQSTATDSASEPLLLESDYCGFNLVGFVGQVYGLARSIGPLDLAVTSSEILQRYVENRACFIGKSVDDVRDLIRAHRVALGERSSVPIP